MNLKEAGELVFLMSSFVNNYEPTKEKSKHWQEVLEDMSYTEAREHFISHFKESEYIPKPVDIIRRARDKQERRVDKLPAIDFSEFAQRIGESKDQEAKIDVVVELYLTLYVDYLAEPVEIIWTDRLKEKLRNFVFEVKESYSERSTRISSMLYAMKMSNRFLQPEEVIKKAFERTEYLKGHMSYD